MKIPSDIVPWFLRGLKIEWAGIKIEISEEVKEQKQIKRITDGKTKERKTD